MRAILCRERVDGGVELYNTYFAVAGSSSESLGWLLLAFFFCFRRLVSLTLRSLPFLLRSLPGRCGGGLFGGARVGFISNYLFTPLKGAGIRFVKRRRVAQSGAPPAARMA